MKREELIESIRSTLSDYREGEIDKVDSYRINRWINQFELEYQEIILTEIDQILRKYYHSRKKIKQIIEIILSYEKFFGKDFVKNIKNTSFLNVQIEGNSQKDLLEIIAEVLDEKFNIDFEECESQNTFFYIDDAIYTGNKIINDIKRWVTQNQMSNKSRLIIFTIAIHSKDFQYVRKNIDKIAGQNNIDVEYWCMLEINNCRVYDKPIETLWPVEVIKDEHVTSYYARIKKRCEENNWKYKHRQYEIKNEKLFTSAENRKIVEEQFTKIGSRIIMSTQNPAKSLRPLGFEKLESVGFGTFFCTYRNIANNCPLVLWYGDPDNYTQPHPFSMWYPLIPRKVNIPEKGIADWSDYLF